MKVDMVPNVFEKLMSSDLGGASIPKAEERGLHGRAEASTGVYKSKSKKKSDLLIEKIADRGFDVTQMEKVFRTPGDQITVSGAGSGKTTVLIFKVLYDQTTGEVTSVRDINGTSVRVMDNVLIATFLKTGAEELKSRYKRWATLLGVPDMSGYIKFSTLHAEFKAALTQMGIPTDIIDAKENRKLLKKVIQEVMKYSGLRFNSEELADFDTALTRTRNVLDPKKRYDSDFYRDKGVMASDIDSILSKWKTERQILGKVDFEDLQEILYTLLYIRQDPIALDVIANRYDYLYVDEFQDTSEIQYAVLKKYIEGAKKVLVIGDDDQTIYSWRGSSADIITSRFQNDFEATYNELTVNYRCPSVVLDSIVPSIEVNENRFEKNLKSARVGGKLRVGYYDNASSMGTELMKMVKEDIKNHQKVTILGRTNADLFLPALLLAQDGGISFSLSNGKMTFDNYIGRVALAVPSLMNKKHGLKVSTALKALVWEKNEVDQLMRVCKSEGKFFSELDVDDLQYSYPHLFPHLVRISEIAGQENSVRALKDLYDYFIADAQKGKGEFSRNLAGVLQAIRSWMDTDEFNNVREVEYDLDDLSTDLKYKVGRESDKDEVRLATVHEFKGKESSSVYVWNDSEGVFPYYRSVDNFEDLEEERRVHYIAATRASESLTLMAQRGNKSRFLDEMDLHEADNVTPSVRSVTL